MQFFSWLCINKENLYCSSFSLNMPERQTKRWKHFKQTNVYDLNRATNCCLNVQYNFVVFNKLPFLYHIQGCLLFKGNNEMSLDKNLSSSYTRYYCLYHVEASPLHLLYCKKLLQMLHFNKMYPDHVY